MGILNDFSLEGKVALVTGASYGIGFAIATAYEQEGATIVFNDIKQELVDKGIASYKEEGIDAHGYVCDVTDEAAVNEMVARIESEVGVIDILVNNAGIFFFDDLTEVTPERIETMLLLHIRTVTLLCRYFGAAMKRRRAGYILNMSSLSAWTPAPGISVYAASKSYIRKFSQMLRYELHQYGVGVTTVCPGAIATGLYNLSDYYQRLALRLGVSMNPERLARKGLRAMFARRDYILPGAVNRFFVLALYLLPVQLIYYIKEHTKLYRYGR